MELIGPNGASMPLSDRSPTLLIAADGKVSGFAGVNRYFTQATFGNSLTAVTPLRFWPVGATRMAGPPERMQLEEVFTAMLARVRSARIAPSGGGGEGGHSPPGAASPALILSGDDRALARFTPAPAVPRTDP